MYWHLSCFVIAAVAIWEIYAEQLMNHAELSDVNFVAADTQLKMAYNEAPPRRSRAALFSGNNYAYSSSSGYAVAGSDCNNHFGCHAPNAYPFEHNSFNHIANSYPNNEHNGPSLRGAHNQKLQVPLSPQNSYEHHYHSPILSEYRQISPPHPQRPDYYDYDYYSRGSHDYNPYDFQPNLDNYNYYDPPTKGLTGINKGLPHSGITPSPALLSGPDPPPSAIAGSLPSPTRPQSWFPKERTKNLPSSTQPPNVPIAATLASAPNMTTIQLGSEVVPATEPTTPMATPDPIHGIDIRFGN